MQSICELFVAQLEAAQMRLDLGEAPPALRVMIEQTPSRIVFSASVPSAGSVSVIIEGVARSLAGIDARPWNVVRLEKELLWQQEGKILSSVIRARSNGAGKSLMLLNEEALQVFGQEQGSWKLLAMDFGAGGHMLMRLMWRWCAAIAGAVGCAARKGRSGGIVGRHGATGTASEFEVVGVFATDAVCGAVCFAREIGDGPGVA
jgi:hypothetical protein